MRNVRSAALALSSLATLLTAAAGRAQQPVEPVQAYTPAPSYSTFNLGAQVTGPANRGRDILLSWGRMLAMGRSGQWMPRLELSAGLNTGRDLVDGVIAGPSVSLGYAFPAQNVSLGRTTRGEPYLIAQASTFGIGRFYGELEKEEAGDEDGWGIAPAFSAGVGVRMFSDEWNVDLSTLEIVVERRLGFGEGDPQLYIRFGRATAPRGARSDAAATTLAPAAIPPPSN
jgi:hypothetical protein